MIGYAEIAAAVSHLDDRSDAGEDIPEIAASFDLDIDGVVGVAQQRALRMQHHIGENAIDFMLSMPKEALADLMLTGMWMDGLTTGLELARRANDSGGD